MRLMRSPRATSSPAVTQGMMRRAMSAGDEAHGRSFRRGASAASKPMQDVLVELGGIGPHGVQELARGVFAKKATRPPTGAFWTCTSNTERKMEMRWQEPPMNCGFGVRVNDVHLAVARGDDEVGAGGNAGLGVAEEVEREDSEDDPAGQQAAGQHEHEGADGLGEKGDGEQGQDDDQGKEDHSERGALRLA